MENKLRVMLLACCNAGDSVYTKGKKRFLDIFDKAKVEFVTNDPDVLVFLSNNAALSAIEQVQKDIFRHYIIMASNSNNAYASAIEVKAWMNQHGVSSTLLEYDSNETGKQISDLYDIKNAFSRLNKRRVYVPHEMMKENVASNVNPFILESRLGIQLGYKTPEAHFAANDEGCFGDVCSAAGMLFVSEICGKLPRVVELSKLASSSIQFEACQASMVLADCCGVPATYLDSLQDAKEFTLFRLDNTLFKAFIAVGQLKKLNANQLSVELTLSENDLRYFTEFPLGNHHLLVSGNYAQKLSLACRLKKITMV